MHLVPGPSFNGHFNVLRGYVAPLDFAGVKVVGDYVDNYRRGLPSEMGLLNLFDPATGQPLAIIDAAGLTDMRTGAVTAIGAAHLAREEEPRPRAHRRARHRLLERAPARLAVPLRRDPRALAPAGKPRRASPRRLARDLGKPVDRDRRLGKLRARRRHRRRGVAPAAARAAAQDRLDQARRIRRAVRHDERGGAVAHRHHGQAGRRRLGAVQGGTVRQPARACRMPAS